jgi:hypothetical protein
MHCTPSLPDRRRGQRFRIALPVEPKGGTAMTRDFSACGEFADTAQIFVHGEWLRFTQVLEPIAPGHRRHLQCQAKVVCVMLCSIGLGVAVEITTYQLEARVCNGRECRRKRGHARLLLRRRWTRSSPASMGGITRVPLSGRSGGVLCGCRHAVFRSFYADES